MNQLPDLPPPFPIIHTYYPSPQYRVMGSDHPMMAHCVSWWSVQKQWAFINQCPNECCLLFVILIYELKSLRTSSLSTPSLSFVRSRLSRAKEATEKMGEKQRTRKGGTEGNSKEGRKEANGDKLQKRLEAVERIAANVIEVEGEKAS